MKRLQWKRSECHKSKCGLIKGPRVLFKDQPIHSARFQKSNFTMQINGVTFQSWFAACQSLLSTRFDSYLKNTNSNMFDQICALKFKQIAMGGKREQAWNLYPLFVIHAYAPAPLASFISYFKWFGNQASGGVLKWTGAETGEVLLAVSALQ